MYLGQLLKEKKIFHSELQIKSKSKQQAFSMTQLCTEIAFSLHK